MSPPFWGICFGQRCSNHQKPSNPKSMLCVFSMLQLATGEAIKFSGRWVSPAREGNFPTQQRLLGDHLPRRNHSQLCCFFLGSQENLYQKDKNHNKNDQFSGLALRSEWNEPAFFFLISSFSYHTVLNRFRSRYETVECSEIPKNLGCI